MASETDVVVVESAESPIQQVQEEAKAEPVIELFQHGCQSSLCRRFSKHPQLADEAQALQDSISHVPIIHRKERGGEDAWVTFNFTIQSQPMRQVLRDSLAQYQDFDPDAAQWTFQPPFEPLVHRWDTICEMRSALAIEAAGAVQKGHDEDDGVEPNPVVEKSRLVNELVDFLTPVLDASIAALKETTKTGMVRFKDVWQIYPPGALVTTEWYGVPFIGRVVKYEKGMGEGDYDDNGNMVRKHSSWTITLEGIEWNGEVHGYYRDQWPIKKYSHLKDVRSFDLVPLEMQPDPESFKERMLARGRKYEALAGCHYRWYEGDSISKEDGDSGESRPVSGRIVVDNVAYYAIRNSKKPELIAVRDRRKSTATDAAAKKEEAAGAEAEAAADESPSSPASETAEVIDGSELDDDAVSVAIDAVSVATDAVSVATDADADADADGAKKKDNDRNEDIVPLTDEECMLCIPFLNGMDLKTKRWAMFDADNVEEIAWNDDAFEKLVLPKGCKELAWSFVENKALNKTTFDDFVEAKGRGLIMLLFGPPGVGKTFTAEAVAEKARVPLYSLSAAVLGTSPEEVEKELDRALEICRLLNAMLLLDEADIFMAVRNNSDLSRNELVAVFLQKLEYYRGILFLTTNRISSLDHAFQSRVDLFLPYHDLTPEARRQVWDNFIAHAGGAARFDVSEDDLAALSRMRLNGREIKNVAKSATLLSAKGGEKVPAERLIMLAENRVSALEMLARGEKEH